MIYGVFDFGMLGDVSLMAGDDPQTSAVAGEMVEMMVGAYLATQAEALVKALAAAGVSHEHWVDEDMPHGYAQMEFLPAARPAIQRMIRFLRRHV